MLRCPVVPRALAAAFVMLVAVVPAMASSSSAAAAPGTPVAPMRFASDSQMSAEVAANINRERAAHGLGPFTVDGSRYSVVRGQAERNANGACPSHLCHSGNLPPGGGEIVYWGSGTPAGNATAAWMRSASHRALMLDSGATRMSVAVVCRGGGWSAVVQMWAVNGSTRDNGSGPVTGGGSRCSAPAAAAATAPPPPPPPPAAPRAPAPTTPSTRPLPPSTTTSSSTTTTTLPPRALTEEANRVLTDLPDQGAPPRPLAVEPADHASSLWPTTAVIATLGVLAIPGVVRTLLRRRQR
jgi:uncharacterized protein YkwD